MTRITSAAIFLLSDWNSNKCSSEEETQTQHFLVKAYVQQILLTPINRSVGSDPVSSFSLKIDNEVDDEEWTPNLRFDSSKPVWDDDESDDGRKWGGHSWQDKPGVNYPRRYKTSLRISEYPSAGRSPKTYAHAVIIQGIQIKHCKLLFTL
jgi:hypothetical protein